MSRIVRLTLASTQRRGLGAPPPRPSEARTEEPVPPVPRRSRRGRAPTRVVSSVFDGKRYERIDVPLIPQHTSTAVRLKLVVARGAIREPATVTVHAVWIGDALGVVPAGRQHPRLPGGQVPRVSVTREVMTWDDLGTGRARSRRRCTPTAGIPDLVLGISRGGLLVAGGARVCARRQEHGHDQRRVLHRHRRAARAADAAAARPRPRRPHARRGSSSPTTSPTRARRSSSCTTSAPGAWRRRGSPCSTRSRARRSRATTCGAAPTTGSRSRGAPIRPSAAGRRSSSEPSLSERTEAGRVDPEPRLREPVHRPVGAHAHERAVRRRRRRPGRLG